MRVRVSGCKRESRGGMMYPSIATFSLPPSLLSLFLAFFLGKQDTLLHTHVCVCESVLLFFFKRYLFFRFLVKSRIPFGASEATSSARAVCENLRHEAPKNL